MPAPSTLRRTALLLLLAAALSAQAAGTSRAQAWTQPRGGAYVKLAHGRTAAAEQYAADGAVQPYLPGIDGEAFFDRSFYLYAEWGLLERLTLVALVPYKRLEVAPLRMEDAPRTVAALGSVMAGLRLGLEPPLPDLLLGQALALNVLLTLPTGYDRLAEPAVGPGQVDLQATLSYGASLHPLPGYAQAGAGYRFRSQVYALSTAAPCPDDGSACPETTPKYDDELLFSAEAGVSLGRWALVQALLGGVWSNHPPEVDFSPANPLPTRQRYVKAGAGLTLYPLPGLGLSLQYFATPYGRNTLYASDLFLGIEYRLQ